MFEGTPPIQLAVAVLAAGATIVGLYVGYLAFRGMRRHGDPSMWYLAVGLILLTAVTYTTSFVGTLLIHFRLLSLPQQDWFWLAVHGFQFFGLAFIAYALHRRP